MPRRSQRTVPLGAPLEAQLELVASMMGITVPELIRQSCFAHLAQLGAPVHLVDPRQIPLPKAKPAHLPATAAAPPEQLPSTAAAAQEPALSRTRIDSSPSSSFGSPSSLPAPELASPPPPPTKLFPELESERVGGGAGGDGRARAAPLPRSWCEEVWRSFLAAREECFAILGRVGGSPPQLTAEAEERIRTVTRKLCAAYGEEDGRRRMLEAAAGLRYSDWHMGRKDGTARIAWQNVYLVNGKINQVEMLSELVRAQTAKLRRAPPLPDPRLNLAREAARNRILASSLPDPEKDRICDALDAAPSLAAIGELEGGARGASP